MSFVDNWLIAPPIALITTDRASDQRPTPTDRARMICKCRAIIKLIICDDRSISADQLINSADTCQSTAWHSSNITVADTITIDPAQISGPLFRWAVSLPLSLSHFQIVSRSLNPDGGGPVGKSYGGEYDGGGYLVTLLIRVKANDCPDLNPNDGPARHPENHLQKGKILMES